MFIEVPPMDGPVAVISQSGGMSAMAYGLLRGRGIGVRHVHATGNEADVTVSEMAWAIAHDPEIRLNYFPSKSRSQSVPNRDKVYLRAQITVSLLYEQLERAHDRGNVSMFRGLKYPLTVTRLLHR